MNLPFAVPEEFGSYRIGTPVDADLGEVHWTRSAFDMGMLAGAHALNWNLNTEIHKTVQAGGYTAESQDTWAMAVDTSASVSFSPFSTVQASFHMARSSHNARRTSGQKITAIATQKGMVSIVNPTRDLLLKCATDDFLASITRIFTCAEAARTAAEAGEAVAGDAEKKLEDALVEFYRSYGTGFISALNLGAVGIFEGSIEYSSAFTQKNASYGGSLSVSGMGSGVGGGFSAAVEFASKCSQADAQAKLRCEMYGMPIGSAQAQWADKMMEAFDNQQLAKMSNLEAWQPAAEKLVAPHVAPPTIPERKPAPDVPKLPGVDIETQIKNMKLREFKESYRKQYGHEPDAAKYEEWLKELKVTAHRSADEIASVAPVSPGRSKS